MRNNEDFYTPFTYMDEEKTGIVPIWGINAFRGKCSIEPESVAKYLLSYDESEEARSTDNPSDIRYQDFLLPTGKPDPLLRQLMIEIVGQLRESIGKRVGVLEGWTIIHHKDHQTYPHTHSDEDDRLACVYWARVPEGSGVLELYPQGMPSNLTIHVKPVAGEFLVFPASLLHGVRTNSSDDLRISMSLNLQVVL